MLKLLTLLSRWVDDLLRRWRRRQYEKAMHDIETDPVAAWNEHFKRVPVPDDQTNQLPTRVTDVTPGDK